MHFLVRHRKLAVSAAFITALAGVYGATEFFELPPTTYSKVSADNAITKIEADLKQGALTLKSNSEKAFLLSVLDELGISRHSQVLVFSKTSLQKHKITEQKPRAIYFNDNTYVGYVQGGDVEVITHDPKLGMVFYTISRPEEAGGKPVFTRDNSCLRCHVSARTENIPGVFIRSVSLGKGDKLGRLSFDTKASSPYHERWGGWYVTGKWEGDISMGNRTHAFPELAKLSGVEHLKFLGKGYPVKTSDIVALSVLEHQCEMHNLLVSAKLNYERSWYLQKALNASADPRDENSSSFRVADSLAESVVKSMLFVNEAKLPGDGFEGSAEFVRAFEGLAKQGTSESKLRELRLYGRLFKYRCSYMIFSDAFKSLPELVRERICVQLKAALAEGQNKERKYQHLKEREKEVLRDVLVDFVK